jgi:MoxR-like ATPase
MSAPLSRPLIDPERLDRWIEHGLNVLFVGRHGVGKTAAVMAAFERAGLTVRYFSASTMDPWVDLVGVPRPVQRPDGSHVLELVRPAEFEDDAVDAVFLDEFNRAPAKVRNAAMELLQFRSVNGRRFKRLRMVWAAANPSDPEEEYDVEAIDPAQADRFEVRVEIPYRPCDQYFAERYGPAGLVAVEWWTQLSEANRRLVSPRRLEMALRVFHAGGMLRDVIPERAGISRLQRLLLDGSLRDKMEWIAKKGNLVEAKRLLEDPQRAEAAIRTLVHHEPIRAYFLPLLDQERLLSLLKERSVLPTIVKYSDDEPALRRALETFLETRGNSPLAAVVEKLAQRYKVSLGNPDQPPLISGGRG